MQSTGINWVYLLVELVLFIAWALITVWALLALRRRDLPEVPRALWAALVLLVPFAGAIAFWIIRPRTRVQRTDG